MSFGRRKRSHRKWGACFTIQLGTEMMFREEAEYNERH